MKFCKSLQKVAEISDPSYAPFWCNYKYLKKMIKAMSGGRDEASVGTSLSDPSMDYAATTGHHDWAFLPPKLSPRIRVISSRTTAGSAAAASSSPMSPPLSPSQRRRERRSSSSSSFNQLKKQRQQQQEEDEMSVLALDDGVPRNNEGLRKNQREVAFFRLVHAEVKKAISFFDKVERECTIRAQLVTVGMEILQKPQASIVKNRWSVVSRAIFFLYRDLLLLETFAIMTYFSFSKILKKHDKVTGYNTRDPFMVNVVNKANFSNYPKIIELIGRCQELYNKASEKLVQDLHEDERLFLNMVSEWNTRNRDVGTGGASSSEVTDGLSSDTVFGVSHRSRSDEVPQEHQRQEAQPRFARKREASSETPVAAVGPEYDKGKKLKSSE